MKKEKPGIFLLIFLLSMGSVLAQPQLSGTIKVRKPADLQPRIAGKWQGYITPGELCNSQGIYVTQPGIKILAYEINYVAGQGERTHQEEGNVLTSEICAGINKMKNADLVHIYNILAQDELGRKFTLSPIRFSIDIKEPPVISFHGFYQQKLSIVPIDKLYIKIGTPETYDSGPAWLILSSGEPNVLNQVYNNRYRSEGYSHGTYTYFSPDSIQIDFTEEASPYDYRGKIGKGRMELIRISHDGQVIAEENEIYVIMIKGN
jgi:hypothetical protein